MPALRTLALTLVAFAAVALLAAGCPAVVPSGNNAGAGGTNNSTGGGSFFSGSFWNGQPTNNGQSTSANDNAGDDNANENANDNTDAPANLITIEPDDFANESDLTTASASVTLTVTDADKADLNPIFASATDDDLDYAPTGTRVFGHSNVPFFNNDRRLRMDFAQPALYVSLLFAGGEPFTEEIGRLEVYDADDNLLAEYVTTSLVDGASEQMVIQRESADIAWALAYVAENEGSFGRLDALSFAFEN